MNSLADELTEVLHGVVPVQNKKLVFDDSFDCLLISFISLLTAISTFIEFGTTTTTPQALIAIDGSFLTIFSIFSFILSKFLKNFGRNERRRSVQVLTERLRQVKLNENPSKIVRNFETAVKRDGIWRSVPNNLLIKGDVIALQCNTIAIADVIRLSDGKFTKRFDSLGQRMKRRTSSASSSSSPMSTSQSKTMNFLDLIDVEFYRVEASPLVSDVSTFLNEADLAQKTQAGEQFREMFILLRSVAVLGYIIFGIILGVIKYVSVPPAYQFPEFILARSATLLCLLPGLSWSIFRCGIEIYWINKMMKVGKKGDKVPSLWRFPKGPLTPWTLIRLMGSVTALCGLDEDTLLVDSPAVEEVFLLKGEKKTKVIDLCLDSKERSGLRFEDPQWKIHLGSLKPLGLACSLSTKSENFFKQRNYTAKFLETGGDDSLIELFQNTKIPTHFQQLAATMGFDDNLANFKIRARCKVIARDQKSIHSSTFHGKQVIDCVVIEMPEMSTPTVPTTPAAAVLPTAKQEPVLHLVCWGSPALLIGYCSEYWDGTSIWSLDEQTRRQVDSMSRQWDKEDYDAVAFCYGPMPFSSAFMPDAATDSFIVYRPLTTDELQLRMKPYHPDSVTKYHHPQHHPSPLPDYSKDSIDLNGVRTHIICSNLIRGQIFTGMVGSRDQPKVEISSSVETLRQCGIRFVYFSPRETRRSRKVAEKMGLETDWNTSISLSAEKDLTENDGLMDQDIDYADWERKAHMPRGIEAIRKHIVEVDDVPLRVSVFTDSLPHTIAQMLQVLKDRAEVVASFGSPMGGNFSLSFMKSSVGISIVPSLMLSSEENEETRLSLEFGKLACSFTLFDTQISHLHSLLGEGRVALYNYRQANQLFAALSIIGFLGQCASFCVVACPMFSVSHTLWLVFVTIPLQSLSPAFRPRSKQEMLRKRMPWKKTAVDENHPMRRYVFYAAFRLLPCFGFLSGIYFWALVETGSNFSWIGHTNTNETILTPQSIMGVQSMSLIAFVWMGCWVSASFASRTESEIHLERKYWLIWLVISLLAVGLQMIYNCIFAQIWLGQCALAFPTYSSVGIYYVLVLAPPVFVPFFAFPVKKHDQKHYLRSMQMLRLDFETKLGQFSPK